MVRSILKCELCGQSKEGVKAYTTRFGKKVTYFACSKCQSEMRITASVIENSHKKAIESGDYITTNKLRTITSVD